MNRRLLMAVLSVIASLNLHAQHGHLNAGAVGRSQSDRLFFANGTDFVESSGYVKTLIFTNGGRFAGYYDGNITLTSLPLTAESGGPDLNAAAAGSVLEFSMLSFSGPPDSSFGFWDTGSTSPSVSLAPGENSSNLFRLTGSDGSAGSDPYGHIHGRRFTATKPGLYKIGFKLFDTSSNGTNGGPIHTPSEVLPIYFQAGLNLTQVAKTGLVTSVRYGSTANQIFSLEYTTNLAQTNLWLPAAGPKVGDDHFQSLEDPASLDAQRFYRLRADPFIP